MLEKRTACLASALLGLSAVNLSSVTAQDKPEDKAAWKTTAGLGLTLTRGNSRTLLFTGDVTSRKSWEHNELMLGANAAYGTERQFRNRETYKAFGQYNRLFNERLYSTLRVEGFHDAIADIYYRATISLGAGYYFIKNDRTRLSAEAGPGYVFEKVGRDERDFATLRVGERLEHKLNDRARIFQSAEYLPRVEDFGDYLVQADAGIEADITKKIAMRVTVSDSYRSEPAPARQKNDLKLVAGLTYKF